MFYVHKIPPLSNFGPCYRKFQKIVLCPKFVLLQVEKGESTIPFVKTTFLQPLRYKGCYQSTSAKKGGSLHQELHKTQRLSETLPIHSKRIFCVKIFVK